MNKEPDTFYIEAPTGVNVTFICPATKELVSVEAKGEFTIDDHSDNFPYYGSPRIVLDVHCSSCGFSHEIKM